ncbi:hypothetical protein MTR67_015435 [Solanum verrucosum]|uniref:Uncharacterized protein n=1 Tax=Solanum verrucosum TaxID=315347 RepID=A0AAF0QIU1_SOLVR|nr:hypothetical protein MTR67_015435 [Solanum verrucosum]
MLDGKPRLHLWDNTGVGGFILLFIRCNQICMVLGEGCQGVSRVVFNPSDALLKLLTSVETRMDVSC